MYTLFMTMLKLDFINPPEKTSMRDVALDMEFQRIITSFQHRTTSSVIKDYKTFHLENRGHWILRASPNYLDSPSYFQCSRLTMYSNQQPNCA